MRAEDWDRRWEDKALHVRGGPSEVVVAALAGVAPGAALDIGCGNGRHAVWLAEHGFRVTAVDFSEEALRQARERAADAGVEVDWVQADIRTYEPGVEAFSLVLVGYVHLPPDERREVLRRASAAVAAGGTLLLVGHDSRNLDTGAPGPTTASVLYTADDVVAEIPELEVVRAETVRRPDRLEDGTTVEAVDALVRATRPL
jgi:2-polyprenyl-3-methyl-5-hydroxy-6-metoxy-1,4-benzoquinol methylase